MAETQRHHRNLTNLPQKSCHRLCLFATVCSYSMIDNESSERRVATAGRLIFAAEASQCHGIHTAADGEACSHGRQLGAEKRNTTKCTHQGEIDNRWQPISTGV